VHVAHTAASQQYAGLKYTADHSAARWLAHLLRLGGLPEGSIDPKAGRAVRDLVRKRSQLVQHKTTHWLSIENLLTRTTGRAMRGNRIKQRTAADVAGLLPEPELALAVKRNRAGMRCLETQMATMAQTVTQRVKWQAECNDLRTGSGMGQSRALTMMLETGDIRRFPTVGTFAASCRCVGSETRSNGKRKGSGNTKNGHKYLAGACMEAAHFAVRSNPCLKRVSQRQQAKTTTVVATKAVPHTLARACFYILRDQGPFAVSQALQ